MIWASLLDTYSLWVANWLPSYNTWGHSLYHGLWKCNYISNRLQVWSSYKMMTAQWSRACITKNGVKFGGGGWGAEPQGQNPRGQGAIILHYMRVPLHIECSKRYFYAKLHNSLWILLTASHTIMAQLVWNCSLIWRNVALLGSCFFQNRLSKTGYSSYWRPCITW